MPRTRHYRPRKQYKLNCQSLVCGDEFLATRRDARFCSPACRKHVNRVMQLIASVKLPSVSVAPIRAKKRSCIQK